MTNGSLRVCSPCCKGIICPLQGSPARLTLELVFMASRLVLRLAVVREMLRINPIVPALFRRALKDFELSGRRIPKVNPLNLF